MSWSWSWSWSQEPADVDYRAAETFAGALSREAEHNVNSAQRQNEQSVLKGKACSFTLSYP